MIILYITTEPL